MIRLEQELQIIVWETYWILYTKVMQIPGIMTMAATMLAFLGVLFLFLLLIAYGESLEIKIGYGGFGYIFHLTSARKGPRKRLCILRSGLELWAQEIQPINMTLKELR